MLLGLFIILFLIVGHSFLEFVYKYRNKKETTHDAFTFITLFGLFILFCISLTW